MQLQLLHDLAREFAERGAHRSENAVRTLGRHGQVETKMWKRAAKELIVLYEEAPEPTVRALHELALGSRQSPRSRLKREVTRVRETLLEMAKEREAPPDDDEIRNFIYDQVFYSVVAEEDFLSSRITALKGAVSEEIPVPEEPPQFPPEKYYTLQQASEVLAMDEQHILALIEGGEIQGHRDGDDWKFSKVDIDHYHRLLTAMYSLDEALKELQIEDEELNKLVDENEIRVFHIAGEMKFRKSDIDKLKEDRMGEPTMIIPAPVFDEEGEERIAAEEDLSEMLLDIEDLIAPESDVDEQMKEGMIEPTIVLADAEEVDELDEALIVEEDTSETRLDIDDLDAFAAGGLAEEVDFGTAAEDHEWDLSLGRPEPADWSEEVLEEEPEPAVDRRDSLTYTGAAVDLREIADKYQQLREEEEEEAEEAEAFAEDTVRRRIEEKPKEKMRKRAVRPLPAIAGKIEELVFPKSKKEHTELPLFERALSENAGRPGAVERLVAQSKLALKTLQATIGLRFVLVANALDTAIGMFTGYVNGIFQAWKMTKSIQRRLRRRDPEKQWRGLVDDLAILRYRTSRLLAFAGFRWIEYHSIFANGDVGEQQQSRDVAAPTFALKLTLDLRNHLDEMKRDLSLLTMKEAKQTARKSIGDFLWSFIPNPLDMLLPWKDFVLLAFAMKYSRAEIEAIYADLVVAYRGILRALEEHHQVQFDAEQLSDYQKQLAPYERELLCRVGREESVEFAQVEQGIEECRRRLQRVLQMLCNPLQFVDVRRWPRGELVHEIEKSQKSGHPHIGAELELERWLTSQVERVLAKKESGLSTKERRLRRREAEDLRRRYWLWRKMSELCL